ncbi:bacterial alpha-L-rhamnosidase-domain-containing protein [Aspergillus pseudotamarii]|uniref:alpha-L-rhamnosidase n=1 Tax=Aspergillus pseudotamarii TaxID=132259 RepID=A0A5N6SGB5_ASPPS|nr:bacterial alpha-L-rhamnosidase-domain-containing protein [Aspergillus pseudotamarii]KAE8133675.1 bacterial alpha-L-rhamnosidase-domain-containing protein [Aspergillus pseudotamarii]
MWLWYTPALTGTLLMLLPAWSRAAVQVTHLTVDGRTDSPLDLGNSRPTLTWQINQTHNCNASICPGDRQTAYEIQAAKTIADLSEGRLIWDSGKVDSNQQQVRFGSELKSRDSIAWHVRVWDAYGDASDWSWPATWTTGLLEQTDWGEARWIDYPGRTENQPLPLFARPFDISHNKTIAFARLYLAGIGLHHATVNGEEITDEVLAPGYSNWQLSTEYRTYDVKKWLQPGMNVIGVSLGNGPAYVRRSVKNPSVGRTSPYSWWESQLKGNGTLVEGALAGSINIHLNATTGYHVGGSINIDTGGGGEKLESRTITAIGNKTITFAPGLTLNHKAGAQVTGSGNNIAASDASAGAAVTPRLIGRLEITYSDDSKTTIVTNRYWRTTLGPLVTDAWYSGSDYNATREQVGWDRPGADLNSHPWIASGLAPPPNLATRLVARAAEPVKIQERLIPVSVTEPVPGTWVFDFGQNIAGFPLLNLPELPAGTTIKVAPAESLAANGTVDQASLGPGDRGRDLFITYTTAGRSGGETWHPKFNYFGMQWVQVTGLPSGYKPSRDLITGLRVQADVPFASSFTSSSARLNRIHKMAWYSMASNIISVFTDCPGREKLPYPADFTQPFGALARNFQFPAFLRTAMHHLVEGQSIANTSMAGNVALKTPVYDWGYRGRFGDEINWGNAIVLVPSLLYDLYGDTTVMAAYYDRLVDFVHYIQREKARGHIVDAALGDWVEDGPQTSGRITGTWGYYLTVRAMARIANLTGHHADADRYNDLSHNIRNVFHSAFWNDTSRRYTNTGNNGTSNATQAAQALALDSGLVPEEHRQEVLNALVELTYHYPSSDGQGPHLSGGQIGLGPIVRALSAGGRDDILWEALQQNDRPSYGYFMAPTEANPHGFTTIGEEWDRSSSKNHMILAQIDEWLHAGVVGIQPTALTTISSTWEDWLIFQPKLVGDLRSASGSYQMLQGEARCEWQRTAEGNFNLTVTVPANVEAEVRLPSVGNVTASQRARFVRVDKSYTIYAVPAGTHVFNSETHGMKG